MLCSLLIPDKSLFRVVHQTGKKIENRTFHGGFRSVIPRRSVYHVALAIKQTTPKTWHLKKQQSFTCVQLWGDALWAGLSGASSSLRHVMLAGLTPTCGVSASVVGNSWINRTIELSPRASHPPAADLVLFLRRQRVPRQKGGRAGPHPIASPTSLLLFANVSLAKVTRPSPDSSGGEICSASW